MLTKVEINRLRSLREKKCREEQGVFVVEGAKVTGELLAEGFPLVEIFATSAWDGLAAAARARVPVRVITPGEMARISHFPTPSPVLAVGRIERTELAPGEMARGFTLALDGVQDAGNVGTLLRVADWFAFDRVVCSPACADVFSQKVINASMGSFSRVRIITAELAGALAEAAGAGVPVLGCDLEGESVHALAPLEAAVVVIGSEGGGLSPEVSARVTRRVTIPRHGRAESLNAGVAAAIVCDNLRRVRQAAGPGDPVTR
ncbi:RNA methyltransferase [Termitidicoccus mucosus]|uniref:RNA methyltransferase n=2 Tax=Termitidicoccus mucosus TaxID=1184151 RepID=A0A178IEY0_9BACT|nr:RNA methyltransferase [Opitutaceae bacterium TSB47]